MKKLLSLTRSHLLIFAFISLVLGDRSKEYCCDMSKSVLPIYLYAYIYIYIYTHIYIIYIFYVLYRLKCLLVQVVKIISIQLNNRKCIT